MYKPYCVIAPNYEVTSGGIRVMYALRSWLEIKGQIALTNAVYQEPFVAIYPEIYHGNEAGGKVVVRYILNKPGVMAAHGRPGPTEFNKTDLIYVFSRMYDVFGVDDEHVLFLPVLNLHLFKDYGKERPNTCYFVGKGDDLKKHPNNAIELTRQKSVCQSSLADTLNTCHTMYCYDDATAMTEIARLCGCRVIIYPKTRTLEDWGKYEPGMDGINWGEDKGFRLHTTHFRDQYKSLIREFEDKIDLFIDRTQQ